MFFDTRRFRRGIAASVLTAVSLLAPTTQAHAFGGVSVSDSGTMGTCTFVYEMNINSFSAAVAIASGNYFYPDDLVYDNLSGGTIPSSPNDSGISYSGGTGIITTAAIEACGFTNVLNLTQNGADKTYATDDYMGFSFRGTIGGVTSDYVFALEGVTNTVFTETAVVVPPPPLAMAADAGADVTALAGADVPLSGTVLNIFSAGVTQVWTASGGTLTNATTLTPTFTVPAGAAAGTVYTITLALSEPVGGGGAPNTATDTMTITVTAAAGPTEAETQAAITTNAQTRMNSLIALQPDLLSIIGGGDGAANVTVSSRGGMVDVSTPPGQNAWLRLKGNWSTIDGTKSDYILGAAGTHVQISENVTLGAMLQFDHLATVNGAETLTANGFLLGPYIVATLPDQPLTFDGRLLFGKASNSYAPLGTYVDHFDSQRVLGQFGMSGKIVRGKVTWKPSLHVAYARERSAGYTDGVGTRIGATDTKVGQVAAGVEASFALPSPSGALTATLGLSDIWTGALSGGSAAFEGHRGKVSAGINRAFAGGQNLSLTASYDGLGTNNYKSVSLDLLFQHRF